MFLMNIPKHATANIITVFPLSYFLGWNWKLAAIFLFAGIAIDIDHLFFFTIKHKTVNPVKWFAIGKKMREKMQPGLYIFHSPEFNLLLAIFSYYNEIVLAIFLSNIIHLSLDIYEHYKYHKSFIWIKKWSIVYSLINDN